MTQIVAQEEANFAPFRRALRKEDRAIFDRLFAAARHHTAPAAYLSRPVPFEVILLAMLLEMAKLVEVLRARVETFDDGGTPGAHSVLDRGVRAENGADSETR